MGGLEAQLVLEQDDGPELASVVFNIKSILFALDDSVAPTHTDVVDPDLRLVAPSQLEFTLIVGDREQVDVPRGVLVQRHRLKQDIVSSLCLGNLVGHINNLENSLFNLEGVWIHVFADLALESLPVEGPHVLSRLGDRLLLLLGQNPRFEALEVDQAH